MQSFSEFNLSPNVLKAIQEVGYETPSPIQAQSLPLLLGTSNDFLGLAATGTGKTAAFAIPLLERIDPRKRAIQGLILCPTRELAMQVTEQVNLLGKYLGVSAFPIYGGGSYIEQYRGLERGLPVVVGTPGRICDHIRRGSLKLENLKVLILDEADEMISMGFKDELTAILDSMTPGQANTWLFSATMSPEVRKVADTYLNAPKQVQVNRTEMVPTSIEQRYYVTQESNKPEVLRKLIDAADDFYGIVFCQTKVLVTEIAMYLQDRGYRVDSLHGDKSQNARETTMKAFRERKVKLLVCTDVAARGLDVKDVTHVINYSVPRELDNYVHRIGRTARCGKSGVAMSLISPRQRHMVKQIEQLTKSQLIEGVIPSRRELGSKKVASMLSKFQAQESFSRVLEVIGPEWKKALEGMDQEEIAARFLALTFAEIFSDREPEKSRIMPVAAESEGRKGGFGPRRNNHSDSRNHAEPRRYNRDARRGDDSSAPAGKDFRPRQSASRKDDFSRPQREEGRGPWPAKDKKFKSKKKFSVEGPSFGKSFPAGKKKEKSVRKFRDS